jgi:hypothetical protein
MVKHYIGSIKGTVWHYMYIFPKNINHEIIIPHTMICFIAVRLKEGIC